MAKITESVVIDGKGGALNGIQNWVDACGTTKFFKSLPGRRTQVTLYNLPICLDFLK